MIGAETLWIMEKADGIYPRISRADRSPTWVWQGQPGVRARQICQRQVDSCIAIPSLHPIPRHAVHEGHRAGPGLLAHTCAKENTRSQSSQGGKKCFGPHGIYGSHSIQWVHKRPPNCHLPNTPSKRMDTEATTLSPASWKIVLSPLWEAVLRIHTYHSQPYQAFRDLPGICYYWTHGHTGNGHTESVSDHCSLFLFLAVKRYLLVMGDLFEVKQSLTNQKIFIWGQVFFCWKIVIKNLVLHLKSFLLYF